MVILQVNARKLSVSVRDKGCGFDMKELGHKDGLGILAMEERVHLLSGGFVIQSAPGEGTTVNAWVPLAPNSLVGPASESNRVA